MSELITVISLIFGGGSLGVLITVLANKSKNKAEIKHIDAESDAKIGSSWKEYAHQMKTDFEAIRDELHQTNLLVAELKGTLVEKDKHISSLTQILQNRNPDLVSLLTEIKGFMQRIHETTTSNTKELHHQTRMMNDSKTESNSKKVTATSPDDDPNIDLSR